MMTASWPLIGQLVTTLSSDWLRGVINILARDNDTPRARHPAQTIKTRQGSNKTFYEAQVPFWF